MKLLTSAIVILFLALACYTAATRSQAKAAPQLGPTKVADSLLELLSQPRFAILNLGDHDEAYSMFTKLVHRENFQEILAKHAVNQDSSLEEQNAYLVLRARLLNTQATVDKEELIARASAQSRDVSDEEYDNASLASLRRLREITEGFRELSRQGLTEGVLNYCTSIEVIKISYDSDPTWYGSYGDTITPESLSDSKKALRAEALKLMELSAEKSQADNKLHELVNRNHWPSVEVAIRRSIHHHADQDEIQKLVEQFAKCEKLDGYAYDYLAKLQSQLAFMKKEVLPNSIAKFARLALDSGISNAYRTLYDYHQSRNEVSLARQIVEQGATAGQKDCVFKLGCLQFAESDFQSAEKTLKDALDAGFVEATVFLGLIYETGADGVSKDLSKALHYIELGRKANLPEAYEKTALFYFGGILNAQIPDLEYQIPGLPRLPEPTNAQKQRISNCFSAAAYLTMASELYAKRGETEAAQRTRKLASTFEQGGMELSRTSMQPAGYGDWTTEDDYRLDRQFGEMIEHRNQEREVIEQRNRRIDRMYDGY